MMNVENALKRHRRIGRADDARGTNTTEAASRAPAAQSHDCCSAQSRAAGEHTKNTTRRKENNNCILFDWRKEKKTQQIENKEYDFGEWRPAAPSTAAGTNALSLVRKATQTNRGESSSKPAVVCARRRRRRRRQCRKTHDRRTGEGATGSPCVTRH